MFDKAEKGRRKGTGSRRSKEEWAKEAAKDQTKDKVMPKISLRIKEYFIKSTLDKTII